MSTAGSVARISARVLAVVVSAASLVVIGYAWKNVHDLDAGTQVLPDIKNLGATPTPLAYPSGTAAAPPAIKGKAQNILIVGNDDRNDMSDAEVHDLHTGRSGGSINTDTMMIVHIPADGSKATLISLPRDAYVDIPGYVKSKLNAAYPDGYTYGAPNGTDRQQKAAGASVLIKTISNLTGLIINHYVQVDLIGFYRISNAIGPITANLCHATSDPHGAHFSAPAGPVSLVGVRALEFVRQRDNVKGGDLGRAARQRYFLTAAFRRIVSLGFLTNPGRLHNLIEAVDKSIYTDGLKITELAAQLADLDPNDISGTTIPTDGNADVDIAGQEQSVLLVNPVEVRTFVANLLNHTGAQQHHRHHGARPIDKGCIN